MTLLRLKSYHTQKTRLFTRALCRRTKEGHKLTVVRDSARSIVVGYLTRMNRWGTEIRMRCYRVVPPIKRNVSESVLSV